MGSDINARVPNFITLDGFFFDHEYTVKFRTAQTSLNRALGSAYFKYQLKFLTEHYRIYDGGV